MELGRTVRHDTALLMHDAIPFKRAIDFGASVVFMALCARAFCVHFYKDIERQLHRRNLPAVDPSPLIPPDWVLLKPVPVGSIRSTSPRPRPPLSYSRASIPATVTNNRSARVSDSRRRPPPLSPRRELVFRQKRWHPVVDFRRNTAA